MSSTLPKRTESDTSAETDPVIAMQALIDARRFREALDRCRQEVHYGDDRPEVMLLGAMAAARIDLLDVAEDLASRAVGRFVRTGDVDGRMRATNIIGAVTFARGDLRRAEVAFSLTLRLAEQRGDALFLARACNNLATIADLRGDPERALDMYQSALKAYHQLGDLRGTAETYHNLTLTYRQLAKWDDAERASDEAIRHAETLGEGGLLALAVCARAELDLEHDQERAALAVAGLSTERASETVEGNAPSTSDGDVERVRAIVALRQHDFATARDAAERAREIATQCGNSLLVADANAASALAHRGLGLEGVAIARYQRAIEEYTNLGAVHFRSRFLTAWHNVQPPRRRRSD